jgi:formylglycine-generating enzyme required for sulfatase activity/predicted Ser/Thr protein kinase
MVTLGAVRFPSGQELVMAAEFPRPGTVCGVTLPAQFGPYRVVRRLGRGGMGVVFLAEDTRLSRHVAIKVCNIGADNAAALERFRREARSAALLRHPNLCPVYEFDVCDGIPYLAMAYIDGPTLAEWMAPRLPLDQRLAAGLVAKLAVGMRAAHAQGVIHRDLKPGNVLLDKGEPIIVDFGLARKESGEGHLTQLGAVLGTPAYMSPEQVAAEGPIGPASDVYSLGVILFELLTGRCPFSGTGGVVLAQILYDPTPPPRTHRPDLDAGLEAVCLKALAKSPQDRHASMSAFAKALAPYSKSSAPGQKPVKPVQPPPPRVAPSDTDALQPPTHPAASPHQPPRAGLPTQRAPGVAWHILLLVVGLAALAAVISLPWWTGRPANSPSEPADRSGPSDETKPTVKAADGNKPTEPVASFTNSVDMKLLLIKPGTFEMGSSPADADRFPDEFRHRVRITRPFYLAATEVTQAQFERVMGKNSNSSTFTQAKGGGPDHPVEAVTWYEAVDFCKRLSALEKRAYRLPTEAEWEYACRADTTGPYNFSGAAGLKGHGWYADNAGHRTQPVGSKPANGWGLVDMHGNVAEWCADTYDKDYYRHSPAADPFCQGPGETRVARGGAWSSTARNCRSANRIEGKPDFRYNDIGFRVALSVDAQGR